MPRYYFHVHDGSDIPDVEGTELPDRETAKQHAIRYASDLLRAHDVFWDGRDWSMNVSGRDGKTLFTLHFLADDGGSNSLN